MSLDNIIIGGYRIRAGRYNRDVTCTDPEHCALAKKDGLTCATTFTDRAGKVFCPSSKGSNAGKISCLFIFVYS